jgi:hypothetical protein
LLLLRLDPAASVLGGHITQTNLDTVGEEEVVFDGKFYGPGLPNPKLPDAVKISYLPGCGHLVA